MKKMILVLSLLVGCVGTEYETCDDYNDLCSDGSNVTYSVCADDYGAWYEVGDESYLNADNMLLIECGW